MGGFGHVAVVEAVQFVEGDVLVAVEAEHADEVGIFLVASEEFHLAVSGDDEHRRCVSAYIVEGRKVVDRRSEVTEVLLAPLGEMGDDLAAVWHQSLYLLVRIDVILGKVFLVQAEHVHDIPSCRVTCKIHF